MNDKPLSGALGWMKPAEPDMNISRALRDAAELAARTRNPNPEQLEQPQSWVARAVYTAAYNATNGVPTGQREGVPTNYGRVWAEGRSLTNSGGGGAFKVTLISSQNGVRATIEAPDGTTISGGSVRFWLQDPSTLEWALGGVEETIATGVQRVVTTDQFVTVGGR